MPHYGWVDRERSRAFDGTWQADWVQSRAGILEREGQAPEAETGVRLTVLGAPATRVYVGEGPLVDGPPHHRLDGHPEPSCPLVLVRRKAAAATFAAVHEPYSGRPPSIRSVSLLQESDEGIGMKVEAEGFSDRLLVGFGSSPRTILIRSPDGGGVSVRRVRVRADGGRIRHRAGEVRGVPHPRRRPGRPVAHRERQERARRRARRLPGLRRRAGEGSEAAPWPATDPGEIARDAGVGPLRTSSPKKCASRPVAPSARSP